MIKCNKWQKVIRACEALHSPKLYGGNTGKVKFGRASSKAGAFVLLAAQQAFKEAEREYIKCRCAYCVAHPVRGKA